MEEQEQLVKNIKLLSDSIRKKNRALKSDISERESFLETTFKPVVGPLKEISSKLTSSVSKGTELLPVTKTEVEDTDNGTTDVMETENDDDNDVNTVEEEEDELEGDEEEEEGEAEEGSSEHAQSRLSLLSQDIGYKGDLTKKYVLKMLHSDLPKRNYHVYGVRLTEDGLMIGDSKISIDNSDNLTLRNRTFRGTPGLFELLFTKDPKNYKRTDLETFKTIMKITNAHKHKYSSKSPIYRNKTIKYQNIIKKLFPTTIQRGKGMIMKNSYDTNVIYYNDVNKLVNRMRLLYEAKDAGHTGVDNEIIALTEELRSRGYIL